MGILSSECPAISDVMFVVLTFRSWQAFSVRRINVEAPLCLPAIDEYRQHAQMGCLFFVKRMLNNYNLVLCRPGIWLSWSHACESGTDEPECQLVSRCLTLEHHAAPLFPRASRHLTIGPCWQKSLGCLHVSYRMLPIIYLSPRSLIAACLTTRGFRCDFNTVLELDVQDFFALTVVSICKPESADRV